MKEVIHMVIATNGRLAATAKPRSLELADERGHTACSWAAKTLEWVLDEVTGDLVSLDLSIASAHNDGAWYVVRYIASRDDAVCECQAAVYGRPCYHRGLAILCGRAAARSYSPAGRAESAREYEANLSRN